VGDVNKDGFNDLAISLTGPTSTIEVALANGDGTFQTPKSITTKVTVGALGLADMNGDGRADVVAADDLNLRVWLSNADGSIATPAIDTPLSYQSFSAGSRLYLADLNGDGRVDAVPLNGKDFGFSVLYGDGNGGFVDAPGPTLQAPPKSVGSADFNGDAPIWCWR
jgi:Tfp pilus tip-associated adhesin PilY1